MCDSFNLHHLGCSQWSLVIIYTMYSIEVTILAEILSRVIFPNAA